LIIINQKKFVVRVFLILSILTFLREINSCEVNDSANPLADAYFIVTKAANGCLYDSDRAMLQQQFLEIKLDEFKIPEISTLSVETIENACRVLETLKDAMRNHEIAIPVTRHSVWFCCLNPNGEKISGEVEQATTKEELLNLLNKVRDLAQQADSDLITANKRIILQHQADVYMDIIKYSYDGLPEIDLNTQDSSSNNIFWPGTHYS